MQTGICTWSQPGVNYKNLHMVQILYTCANPFTWADLLTWVYLHICKYLHRYANLSMWMHLKTALKIKRAQVKRQGDSSFPADGHTAILNKMNNKSKTDGKQTIRINHKRRTALERSVINYWRQTGFTRAQPSPWVLLWFIWTASSEFGTYRLCEQRRFTRACASAHPRQNLRCSPIQAVRVSQEVPSDRKPDPLPLWMAGHAQLKFVMTECSKTQIPSYIQVIRSAWRISNTTMNQNGKHINRGSLLRWITTSTQQQDQHSLKQWGKRNPIVEPCRALPKTGHQAPTNFVKSFRPEPSISLRPDPPACN